MLFTIVIEWISSRHNTIKLFIFCFTLFGLLINNSANAENSPTSFQQKTLTIAVNKTTYPYQFVDEHGNVAGVMIDLWRLWAKQQHVKIKFIPLNWSQTLAQVKSGKIDIHAGLAITTQRRKYLAFSPTIFTLKNYFYVNQKLTTVHRIEQLKPYTIGVVKNSTHMINIKKYYPNLHVKTFPSRFAKYKAALRGEIFIFAGIDKLSESYPKHKRLQQQYPLNKRLVFSHWNYAVAVAKNNKKLLNFINHGFNKINLEKKSAIERKWLGVDKKNDTLLVAFSPNVPPFMAFSPSEKPQGLWIDLWQLWSKYTGQKIEFIAENVNDAADMLKKHNVDVMVAYPQGNKTGKTLKKAWHIYQLQSKVFVSSRLKNINNLSDLNGYTLGLFVTAPYKEQIKKQYPKIKIHYFSSISLLLLAAEKGEIDAMVSSTDIMRFRLIKSNLFTSFYLLKTPVFYSNIFSMTASDNARLAEIISEGVTMIPIDKLIAIEKKWLPNKRYYYFEHQKKMEQFSLNEKKWLAQKKLIKVGITKDWRPMEFINTQKQPQGINVDIIKLVADKTDLRFKFVSFDDWTSLYNALLDKKVDMLASVLSTKERRKQLLFTRSYWKLPWVMLYQQQLGDNLSMDDFAGKKIAIVKNHEIFNRVRERFPKVSVVLVDNIKEGYLALKKGMIDGLLQPMVIANNLLKQKKSFSLKMSVMEKLKWNYSRMAVRKDWPELKSIIDKGLTQITKQEKQKIYNKWFGIKINMGLDKKTVLRITLQLGILISVVIGIIVFWNRRLYREVKLRKMLEEQMKHMATHDELTGLGNRALLKDRLNNLIGLHQRQHIEMAVLFIDLDGFKNINDNYGHDVGDELLRQLTQRFKNCVRTSDTLVRFGGDEFVLLLTGLNQGKEAAFIAEKFLHLLKTPFKLSVVTTCVSCSIGIALYPEDGTTEIELLKIADTLMYKVKAQGKNNYIFNRDIT